MLKEAVPFLKFLSVCKKQHFSINNKRWFHAQGTTTTTTVAFCRRRNNCLWRHQAGGEVLSVHDDVTLRSSSSKRLQIRMSEKRVSVKVMERGAQSCFQMTSPFSSRHVSRTYFCARPNDENIDLLVRMVVMLLLPFHSLARCVDPRLTPFARWLFAVSLLLVVPNG